ncbi:MAG: hydrogenase maturation nickel metallochaperone HypA [Anaerolineae bacterium]|nr:hydrogenase maturation nickel metallochaperone HypA [Anaerolineae bacterium]
MHELAITEGILRIVTAHAVKADADHVTDIHLVIGDMSSFINDSIQFYFDLLSPQTVAENATLHFHRLAVRFRCWQCRHEFAPTKLDRCCPQCNALGGEVIAGKEFYVESIEVN